MATIGERERSAFVDQAIRTGASGSEVVNLAKIIEKYVRGEDEKK